MKNTTGNDAVRGHFLVKREGQFTVKTFGENHCGLKPLLAVKYNVEITCGPTLDERGFLIEQLSIDEFFQKNTETDLSCERFAVDCARRLWSALNKENPVIDVIEMKVTLSPEPHHFGVTFVHNAERDGGVASAKPKARKAK